MSSCSGGDLNDNVFKITMVRNTVASLLADLTRRQLGDIGGTSPAGRESEHGFMVNQSVWLGRLDEVPKVEEQPVRV